MLLRRDQTRKMLALIHEAREIGPGLEQKLHLVAGIQRIIGAAMTTFAVLRDIGDPRRRRIEGEVSTPPSDRNVRTMIDALRSNSNISDGLQAMSRRLRFTPMVTARRRELLPDNHWYRSESFNVLHRVCGFDDHVYSFRSLGAGRVVALALRRSVGDRPYGDEEQNLLELFHEEPVRLEPRQRSDGAGPRLAPREQDVLQGLLRGASEKEVAFELNLSRHTVHSYAKSIYSAYGVSSRAELLVRCLASLGRADDPNAGRHVSTGS